MAWTDDRIDELKRMWLDGATASQIAEALGGVSRNAVIGKAFRIGLQSMPMPLNPAMLGRVDELPLNNRTKRTMATADIVLVGDLVQKTEAELLRLADFGVKSLDQVKSALEAKQLRLGLILTDWPPTEIGTVSRQFEAAARAAKLRQARGGATFEPVDDHFAMTAQGDENDLSAAMKPMTLQMHTALLEKARRFVDIAARLGNQPGWFGMGQAANTLVDLLDRPTLQLPGILGYLYPVALEIGSFVELDAQLTSGKASYAAPLDPEVGRPLADLVRTLAPWLRSFPSVREADDQAGRFLVQSSTLSPTFEVVEAASAHALLSEADLDVFRLLADAAARGTFQGQKAGGRVKRSASNLVIRAVAFAGMFFSGSVASDVSTTSPLVHKVGQFLVDAEKSIEHALADLPPDLRYSVTDFIKNFPGDSLPPPGPTNVVERGPRPRRAGDHLSDGGPDR